jgi:predicted GNAT family acetyltransferase
MTDSSDSREVKHLPAQHQFVVDLGNEQAMLVYRPLGGEIVLLHTEVPPAWEGRGIAGDLTQAALEYVRAAQLTVRPVCPFVIAYLRQHPRYLPLVREEDREKLQAQ